MSGFTTPSAAATPQAVQLHRRPAATPAQRAVLSRAVLSRRFELAAERLQGEIRAQRSTMQDFSQRFTQAKSLEDDLAQIVGPAPAHQLARWGRAAAQGLALLAKSAARLMPGASGGKAA
mgnify:CR=1 FL=1